MVQSAPNGNGRPLIVVVDDDASFLRSMGHLLRSAGYMVVTFGAGREFLATSAKIQASCLVLDVHMPEMTGFELLREVSRQGLTPPAIFVSAYDTAQSREQARQAGSFGFLLKPFDKGELLDALDRALGLGVR